MSELLRGFKILPKGLVLYLAITSALFSLLWVIIAPYLKEIGFTPLEYGLLGSVLGISSIASLPFAGWLVDRYGALRMVSITLITATLGFSLLLTRVKELIFLSAAIRGSSLWIGQLALDVLVSRVVSRKEYDYAYSSYIAINTLGHALGSYVGWLPPLISSYTKIDMLSAYTIVMGLAVALLPPSLITLKGVKEVSQAPSRKNLGIISSFKDLPRDLLTNVAKVSLAEALIGLGAAISIHNISYYFILKYGIGSGELGTLYGTESLIMALLMLFMPKASKILGGSLKAYVLISLTSIPLLIAMTLVNNYVIASVIYISRTILMNVASPLFTSFLMSLMPEIYRGRALTIVNLSRTISTTIGRGIGGYLLEVELELPLRVTAVLYTTSLTYLYITYCRGR